MKRGWVHRAEHPVVFQAVEAWLAARLAQARPVGGDTAWVAFDGQKIVGVALFHDYRDDVGRVEISAAADGPGWVTRGGLDDWANYAFGQLGCQAVVAHTDPENRRVLKQFKRCGFQLFRIPRLRGRDRDEIICVLTDDAWKEWRAGNGR